MAISHKRRVMIIETFELTRRHGCSAGGRRGFRLKFRFDVLRLTSGALPSLAAESAEALARRLSRFRMTSTMTNTSSQADSIKVEVVYALPHRQELIRLQLASGSTLQQAIERSGLLGKYPEIDLAKFKMGIYGKLSKADTVLRDRDRVEIYRPLIADPKEVRKQRAAEGKVMKKGGGTEEAAG